MPNSWSAILELKMDGKLKESFLNVFEIYLDVWIRIFFDFLPRALIKRYYLHSVIDPAFDPKIKKIWIPFFSNFKFLFIYNIKIKFLISFCFVFSNTKDPFVSGSKLNHSLGNQSKPIPQVTDQDISKYDKLFFEADKGLKGFVAGNTEWFFFFIFCVQKKKKNNNFNWKKDIS